MSRSLVIFRARGIPLFGMGFAPARAFFKGFFNRTVNRSMTTICRYLRQRPSGLSTLVDGLSHLRLLSRTAKSSRLHHFRQLTCLRGQRRTGDHGGGNLGHSWRFGALGRIDFRNDHSSPKSLLTDVYDNIWFLSQRGLASINSSLFCGGERSLPFMRVLVSGQGGRSETSFSGSLRGLEKHVTRGEQE